MLSVTLRGNSELIARLGAMPQAVHDSLVQKVYFLALALEAKVKGKLSDDVLHVRTGALRSSIFYTVTDSRESVRGKVAAPKNVPYAAIHEFGGTIHVPEIVPTKAEALHFFVAGKEVFAKRVAAHTVHMPERSYLRSSLRDMREEIIAGMKQAVIQGMNKGLGHE